MTLREALAKGRTRLQAAGVADASLDARLLLAAATKLDMASLVAHDRETMPAVAEPVYDSYLKRRTRGEPVARILGEAEFWGLRFKLDTATLVPRPDTETLVEAALERAKGLSPTLTLCDLGTGSGAIVIALLTELPEARAVATDISEEALRMARTNAEAHGVADRIRFERTDFSDGPAGPFDVVVANPPYVRSTEIEGLPREVREHDPRAALDGGSDGLDSYRTILARVGKLVREGSAMAFEVGYDQAESVAALCRRAGLSEVAIRRDLGGTERVVVARNVHPEAHPKAAKKALGKVG